MKFEEIRFILGSKLGRNSSADLLYSQVNGIDQRSVLKPFQKTSQREVKTIYEEDPLFVELCKK
jgi:hypothetical protein